MIMINIRLVYLLNIYFFNDFLLSYNKWFMENEVPLSVQNYIMHILAYVYIWFESIYQSVKHR